MQRWLFAVAPSLAILAIDASLLLAADADGAWPELGVPFSRGHGAYLSLWKILPAWLLFLAWVRTTDWISQDAQLMKLKVGMWNPIAFFSFFLCFLLFWLLPWFGVGMLLLLIAYVAPLTTYIIYRNNHVQLYDKVLTRKHLRRWLARKVAVIGIKMEGAENDPRDMGPDIKLTPMGGATERDDSVNLLTARQSPGWLPTRELLDDAMLQRASHVMLDYTPESVAVRYQIDGAWHDRAPMEPAVGDSILAVLKGISARNINDRRSRQSGSFGLQAGKEKLVCTLTSQGTQTGERVLVQFVLKKVEFKTLDELGMRAKMQEQLDALVAQNGVVLFASLPAGGLTTTMDVVIQHTDRFIRSFVAVSDITKPDRDIENVVTTSYSAAAGESPATILPKLVRTYPDVIIVRDIVDLESLTILCEQVSDNRLIILSIRAKEAVEALLRVLMFKIPPADFASVVTGVLNVRLVRKLCEKCKEGYPPTPEVLKQLGLPAGRIEALYRPPTAPIDPKNPEVVCEQCQGVGYYGRTGIFELLVMDDDLRQVLATTPKMENLRAAARKAKHRTLQEEGVLLVARGVTSIQELLRVLKQ